jgi:ribosomal-protein-alanine acetyltransferase
MTLHVDNNFSLKVLTSGASSKLVTIETACAAAPLSNSSSRQTPSFEDLSLQKPCSFGRTLCEPLWNLRLFESELALLHSVSLGLTVKGTCENECDFCEELIGFLVLHLVAGQGHIMNLAVTPKLQQQGAGSTLLKNALVLLDKLGAEEVTLEMRRSNTAAQNLYRKFGFKEVGVRLRYYSNLGETADMAEDAILYSFYFKT